MRYRVIAKSIADRRHLLAFGDDGNYYLLSLSESTPVSVKVDQREAERLQFDRTWVPALDHAPRTVDDLTAQLTYR